ncbi:MAG: DegT/DnrJ/EryC1/StrS family aminotransferase [Planctomycetota bacterium]
MSRPTITCTPPLFPTRRREVIDAAVQQLEHGDWARLEGAPELEQDLAAFHGPAVDGRPGIAWFITSGTAALEAMLLGHAIGPGDEVITTPYTWAATVSAILAIGAVPVFADIDPITGLLEPQTLAPRITERTRAILAVHLFGHPVDCRALRAIADAHDLLLFEDASQAHGARFAGHRVGAWGDAAALSCMGMKPLAGTEGGYALFRDPAAAETAYLYGKHPRGLDPQRVSALQNAGLLDALQLGWRPSPVCAALVRAALPFLDQENAARRANAATLRAALAECPALTMPPELPEAEGVYHLLSLVYDEQAGGRSRAAFLERFAECGGEAFVYIPTPIHRLARINAAGYSGPRVFWHDQLRRAGVDFRTTACPGAEQRSRTSFEMGFNWTREDPEAMQQLAAALIWAAGAQD